MARAKYYIKKQVEGEEIEELANFTRKDNPVKVGDYISDCFDTIRVEGWGISRRGYDYNSLPCLVYQGETCKKDGTPRKHPKKCSVEQRNLLRVNGEPVKNGGYGE